MGIEFSHTIHGQVLVITPHTERLDAMNASAFKDKILGLTRKMGFWKIVFDLSKVQFIDSSGLGAFLAIHRTLSQEGGALKLAHLNKTIQTLFEIVSMHRIFDIFPQAEDAVKSF
jgi:anti-anti-sigma factor